MAFETELQTYEQNKERLLKEGEGQYAVILGSEVIGPYATFAIAFAQAVQTFDTKKFLIKHILRDEPISFIPPVAVVRTDLDKAWRYSTQAR